MCANVNDFDGVFLFVEPTGEAMGDGSNSSGVRSG